MWNKFLAIGEVLTIGAALALVVPLAAQQPAKPAAAPAPNAPAGTPTDMPTKKDPLRFTAFNVSMPTGMSGVTVITIERWSTNAERDKLLPLVESAKWGEGGQRKLLNALQKVKPRVGFIRTPNSIGWDLRYAVEDKSADGLRQIVVVTDKPVSFGAAASDSEAMDYPFTLIQMHMKPDDKGEGRMLAATAVTVKNGKLELENYGQEPVRLTDITEEQKKPKK
jgi:hypothetical protein